MSGRKTIGLNPLSLPTAGGSSAGPGPLDVLIPKAEPVAAAHTPTLDQAAVRAPDPVPASPGESSVLPTTTPRETGAPRPEAAHPPDPGPAAGQYLVFEAGGQCLAISILHVREIVEYGLVTRVPRMPESIRGVTNLRGSIVPVVDLAVRLGLPPQPLNSHTCVVVVEACLGGQPSVVGLVADTVSTVRDLTRDDVSPTPALGAKVTVDAFAGLGRAVDQIFPVLDTERMLASLDLNAQDGAYR